MSHVCQLYVMVNSNMSKQTKASIAICVLYPHTVSIKVECVNAEFVFQIPQLKCVLLSRACCYFTK